MFKKSCKSLIAILLIGLSLNQTPILKHNVKATGDRQKTAKTSQAQTVEIFLLIPQREGKTGYSTRLNINVNVPLKQSIRFNLDEPSYLESIKGYLDCDKTPLELGLSCGEHIALCNRDFIFEAWEYIKRDYYYYTEAVGVIYQPNLLPELKRLQDLRMMRMDNMRSKRKSAKHLVSNYKTDISTSKTPTIIPDKADAPSCDPLPIIW